MKGKYEAAFIIPVGASKKLEEDGWVFEANSFLSKDIEIFLINALNLSFLENYLCIDSYIGENIKMSVFHGKDNEIENIYFQVYDSSMISLVSIFNTSFLTNTSELFIPT